MAPRAIPADEGAASAENISARGITWPVRAGTVPPIASEFTVRVDSVPGIEVLLEPGAAVALVPETQGAGDSAGWVASRGKTQLAVHLAERLWQSRAVAVLAWVDASSRASVLSGYAEAAARLGLNDGGDGEQVAARFLAWLGGAARPWLVVLDDLRDAADLHGLLPGGPAGRVLITTADAGAAPSARRVPVPTFSLREAMGYLSGRLSTATDQRSGAYDLAGQLGCEPTAVAQAGTVMAASGAGCRDYQAYFCEQQERLRAAGREPQAAAVTWRLSADFAANLLPGGGTWPLLALAALLDGHGIPRAVLTAPAVGNYLADVGAELPQGAEDMWKAVLTLECAGLVAVSTPDKAVWVSGALQAEARAAASPELAVLAARAAADAALEAWPKGQPDGTVAARMRACAASLLRHAGDALWDGGCCHRVLLTAGESLDAARLRGPAVAWWREITTRCERLLGGDHPDTLVAAGQYADALLAAGQYAGAAQCARWVADGREQALGPGHPAAVAARISLGRALAASGDPDEALRVLRDAAARSEATSALGDPQSLAVLDEYAAAFLAAGDTATALRFRKRSLGGREQAHGPADPATLAAATRLADTYLADGRAEDAIGHYKRVLAAREQALGPDHPDTLNASASLAASYDAAGHIGDALREHQRACAGCERVLGPDHPVTLARRVDLARAYYAAGQLGDAIAELSDSIGRAERTLPPGDPVTRRLRQVQDGITAGLSHE